MSDAIIYGRYFIFEDDTTKIPEPTRGYDSVFVLAGYGYAILALLINESDITSRARIITSLNCSSYIPG